ncbi:hypothetical protein MTO96_022278 [Rhipicephalus appendiculatus]
MFPHGRPTSIHAAPAKIALSSKFIENYRHAQTTVLRHLPIVRTKHVFPFVQNELGARKPKERVSERRRCHVEPMTSQTRCSQPDHLSETCLAPWTRVCTAGYLDNEKEPVSPRETERRAKALHG